MPPHHGEWWKPARAVRRGAAHGSGGRDAFSASRSAGQPGSRVIEGGGGSEAGRGNEEVETKEKRKSFQVENLVFRYFDPEALMISNRFTPRAATRISLRAHSRLFRTEAMLLQINFLSARRTLPVPSLHQLSNSRAPAHSSATLYSASAIQKPDATHTPP